MDKILIVDDEPSIVKLVRAYLEPEGYDVYTAEDGLSGLQAARAFKPDVIVLDVMLPGMDGMEVLARLRRESDVYVIMLTAKTEETDRVVGLTVGADDYVTKPFSPRELTARIKAALRRIHAGGKPTGERTVLSFQDIEIDISARKVIIEDTQVELTTIEFDLLQNLAENHGRVLSREQLLENVWGTADYGETRMVDVHLGNLRKKISKKELIKTVRGIGYRFEGERI